MNSRKEKKHQISIIFILILFIQFTVSYGQESQTSEKTESELIKKINAVHQQIMVQGNISEEEKQAILSLASFFSQNHRFDNNYLKNTILFKDIVNAPIYNGCEGLSEKGTKECFKESILKFMKQEFNLSVVSALNISEPQQVAAFFVIDENGDLQKLKVRDAEITIQGEIGRVLKKIPKIKPATQDGIKVPVLCSILITYGPELIIEFKYIPEK